MTDKQAEQLINIMAAILDEIRFFKKTYAKAKKIKPVSSYFNED